MSQGASATKESDSKHVVLLDNDQAVLGIYSDILMVNGHTVNCFTDGSDALKLIMKMEVDVILCDLMMPGMAGDLVYQAVQRVKPQLCSRFVFITGFQGHPQFSEFIKREKPMVIYKPLSPGKLIETLRVVLSRPGKH
jgi:DNA-binding NtrC family response regulator